VELLSSLESRFFEAGEVLIARGQEAERVLLIARGSVSVSIPEGGDVLVLATLSAGDVVGEIPMLLRRPSPADMRALYPTLTFEITRERLRVLMRKYPALLVELYELATRRDDEVRAATEHDPLDTEDVILV
jgi:CRP-like cAMP-binding protein